MTGAMEPSARWNDAQLDAMRQTQDPVADPVVAAIFAAGQVNAVNSLMQTLVENDGLPPDALPANVAAYLAATAGLPDWADPAKIAAGEGVFWRYGPAIIAALTCYALPFCYAGRKGVQVLALTARLTSNPERRVIETAQMHQDLPGAAEDVEVVDVKAAQEGLQGVVSVGDANPHGLDFVQIDIDLVRGDVGTEGVDHVGQFTAAAGRLHQGVGRLGEFLDARTSAVLQHELKASGGTEAEDGRQTEGFQFML